MKLIKLKLKNYRNCKNIELDLNSKKVLIIGKNAQGKTNILESIYFLANLKSQRTINVIELINFEEKCFEINADIEKSETEIELDFFYNREKHREIKVNKVKTRPKEFKNILKTVLFSTQDLLLLRGTPQDRRDWLDVAISQIYPAYDDRLSKYNKIRIQKNNFLKDYNQNDTLFEVYNEQLAILGSNIIYLRKKFLKEIEKIAQEKHSTISGSENLTIRYHCNFLEEDDDFNISPSPLAGEDAFQYEQKSASIRKAGEGLYDKIEIEEIAEKFKQTLEERKKEEIRRGQTLVGPHRDDIIFYINGEEGTKFASQGQQRTIVLSLKLAELDIITQKTGEPPILLLDDVLAELDDIRQNYLLKTIAQNTQTIITSVDTLLFDKKFLEDVKIYRIENGK
ncbi:MAG: DNA replication and repair protein RecF [Candidatus Gastranaerophilales bacterium]|nr:DNA replication and repair protein RecF [Candidatus Gastranaerophilales bacterium]